MRTIYVDEDGMSDTGTPIQDGEIALVNINDKFAVTVLGSANSHDPSPCLRCPLGTGVVADELPRCPRVQRLSDDYVLNDYDQDDLDSDDFLDYCDYLCDGMAITSVSDVLGEL
jgi:hypothetical protein